MIRNLEDIEVQPVEYEPYYSIQNRWGRFGYTFRFYERSEMDIDWDNMNPTMESGASWYYDIQQAYQREAQTTYTAVPEKGMMHLSRRWMKKLFWISRNNSNGI